MSACEASVRAARVFGSWFLAASVGVAAGCSNVPPGRPSPVSSLTPPPFSGSWTGNLQVTACSNFDPRECGWAYSSMSTYSATLTTTQDGDAVAGALVIDVVAASPPGVSSSSSTRQIRASVVGVSSGGDRLTLGGTVMGQSADVFEVRDWSSIQSGAGDITGSFALVRAAPDPRLLPLVVRFDLNLHRDRHVTGAGSPLDATNTDSSWP